MYTAKLRLPASYNEIEIARLGEGIEPLAFSALRDENNEKSPWTVEWMFESSPETQDLKNKIVLNAGIYEVSLPSPIDIEIEALPEEQDWLSYSYKQFPAFEVGPFFIYGSHHEGAVPDDKLGLQIDAATAFGSGEHGTTAGCLEAMVILKDQGLCPWNVLDMGTGSGILAIAAWKLWKTPVLAVDNDPEAVRVTDRHCAQNKVPMGPGNIVSACGDGFNTPLVQDKKPYELIIANILAGPLKDMAADLTQTCDENGYVILSGILNEQADDVIKAYEAQGMELKHHLKIKDWSTLILHNAL